jgi:hypothetical protein
VPPLVAFPDLADNRGLESQPGPYERDMGRRIEKLLVALSPLSRDAEAVEAVRALVADNGRWSAGHAVFDAVRRRYLRVHEDREQLSLAHEYAFLEVCAKALYNATRSDAPFDPSSPFWVVPSALAWARLHDAERLVLDSLAEV